MISESIGITGALFQCLAFTCVHGGLQGGQNGEISTTWKLGLKTKNSRKLKSAA